MSQLPENVQDKPVVTRTAHAMLVIWGLFARQLGLVQELERVSIPQRTRDHTPQSKLIEFLVSILSGCKYLQDISQGAHPLDHDQCVARAWGQAGWADYSGVSRTLHACATETVQAVRTAIWRATQPLIDQEVVLALRQEGDLVLDGDLTGRAVSGSSTTYPGVAWGWMDNALRLGYQAAMVSMSSPTYGRIWLSVTHHPGDTVSVTQLKDMIEAAEARTGVRPRRRTEVFAQRIAQQRADVEQAKEKLQQRKECYARVRQKLDKAAQERRYWQDQVAVLEGRYEEQHRCERVYSHLAKARQKLQVRQKRLRRTGPQLRRARQAMQRQRQRVTEMCKTLDALQARYEHFVEQNRTNRAPARVIFRLDAGFGSGKNLALLIEMGYEVYTKVLNANATQAIRRRFDEDTSWIAVASNAEMRACPQMSVHFCPYPLDIGLERFRIEGKTRYAALAHYGRNPVTEDLPAWFAFYNARQTIEAGIREGNQVFEMHHLKVRCQPGLAIQEAFATLAANLVRWAAHWLSQQCSAAQAPLDRSRTSVKHLVRTAANTSAWVHWQSEDHLLLRFDELSAFSHTELLVGPGRAFQLPLPLFRNDDFGHFERFPP